MNPRYLKYKDTFKKYSKSHPEIVKKCQINFKKNHPERLKEIRQKWQQSIKGKKYFKKDNAFHNPIRALKYHRKDWVDENCVICNSSKNIEIHHPNPEMPLHIYFLCKKHHKKEHIGA